MLDIPLTQGKVALIDDEDMGLIAPFRWRAQHHYQVWYAMAHPVDDWRTNIFMHRLILRLATGDPDVDHINGDGLDNRRSNLRLATDSQNQANRHRLSTNTSGYRGVTFHRRLGKWQAAIKQRPRNFYLGVFETPDAAARAYDLKAIELFGEFARTNFGAAA